MHIYKSISYVTFVALTLRTIPAGAVAFPDVPTSHLYKEAIEFLSDNGVIGGHPDGTFKPGDPVNRAAMLKMLYKAADLPTDPHTPGCFKDVVKGSWYEPFVCNAVRMNFVGGYDDKTFRPDKPVNRVEAIKMIALVFKLDVNEISDQDRNKLSYTDISTSAWYAPYLYAAAGRGILPIIGQTGAYFYPDRALTRGEAAAYIHNALMVKLEEEAASSSSAAAASASSRAQASSAAADRPEGRTINLNFPFSDSQTFDGKAAVSYRFGLDTTTVVSTKVQLRIGEPGGVSCRLYRLTNEGYSLEYYLGYEEGSACYLLTTLTAGNYQLQLQPTVSGTQYSANVTLGAGDGNDGFSEAKTLEVGKIRTEFLESNDFEDWYKFTLSADTQMTLEVLSKDSLRCLIYPGSSVDLFGFNGPKCNESYLFPQGTYHVGVGHASPKAERQTYTIRRK